MIVHEREERFTYGNPSRDKHRLCPLLPPSLENSTPALSGSIKIQQLEKPYMEVKAEAKLGQDIEAGGFTIKDVRRSFTQLDASTSRSERLTTALPQPSPT